jgi:hypothetical protein
MWTQIVCLALSRRLWDYQAGRLSDAEAKRIATHLTDCPHCRAQAALNRQILQQIATDSARTPTPSPTAWRRLRMVLETPPQTRSLPGLRWWKPAFVCAAFALGAVCLLLIRLHGNRSPDPVVRAVLPETHRTYERSMSSVLTQQSPERIMRNILSPSPRQRPAPDLRNQRRDGSSGWAASPKNGSHPPHAVDDRRAPITDEEYLNGRDRSLSRYWAADTPISAHAAFESKLPPLRDNFISIAPPLLAMAGDDARTRQLYVAAINQYKKEADTVDTRLFRKVSLQDKGVSVTELCQQLQTQTDVSVSAMHGVSDEKVTVFVKELPARDVMRAVAQVFGYRWAREGDEGAFKYTLTQDLRSQLDEEEMRNRDVNAALLDLDAKMKKLTDSSSSQSHQALARIYDRLAPADRLALRSGQILELRSETGNPDHQIPENLRRNVLTGFTQFYVTQDGRASGPNEGMPLADYPTSGADVQMFISHSELGELKLQARINAYFKTRTNEDRYLVGTRGVGAQTLASGQSPSIAKPDNARWNRALQQNRSFLQQIEFHPVSSCRRKMDWGFDPNTRPETFDEMLERQEDQTTPLPVPHVTSADIWEAVHQQTGIPIVADYYTHLYSAHEMSQEKNTLFAILCKAGDRIGVHWRKEGDLILARSNSFYWDKQKEVPDRLLTKWRQDSRAQQGLPFADFLEMALLSDVQLDSVFVGQGIRHCWELDEWGRVSVTIQDWGRWYRGLARFLAAVPPEQVKRILSPEGFPVNEFAPAQQLEFIKAMSAWNWSAATLDGSRLHIDYIPSGWYVWNPAIRLGQPGEDTFEKLPAVAAKTRIETLDAAEKVDKEASMTNIHRTKGVFGVTLQQANGRYWSYGKPGPMTQ